MHTFHHILYVTHALNQETHALELALSLAHDNNATLSVLLLYPKLPSEIEKIKTTFEDSLLGHLKTTVLTIRERIQIGEADVPLNIQIQSDNTPSIGIIRHVLRNDYDLVVKEAETNDNELGFKAMDMVLIRKSPCPVWLCRPINHIKREIKLAVAIDPESDTPEGYDLTLNLLKLSRALADTFNGELNIISCWDYKLEGYLKHNVWIKVSEQELDDCVTRAHDQHRSDLDKIIEKSGISGMIKINHVRGPAEEMIPKLVSDNDIDILVMGTVARTGIQGFIIGNTAENVVQKLECTLLALKPNGFVSPVSAY